MGNETKGSIAFVTITKTIGACKYYLLLGVYKTPISKCRNYFFHIIRPPKVILYPRTGCQGFSPLILSMQPFLVITSSILSPFSFTNFTLHGFQFSENNSVHYWLNHAEIRFPWLRVSGVIGKSGRSNKSQSSYLPTFSQNDTLIKINCQALIYWFTL